VERPRERDGERSAERASERGERSGDRSRDRDRPRRAERRDEGRDERSQRSERDERGRERSERGERGNGRSRRERPREDAGTEVDLPPVASPDVVSAREAGLADESRTRGIDADRSPREGERGKRKPRRDRSEIARAADEGARERAPRTSAPVVEAQPNAEVVDITPSATDLFPERSDTPVDRASNDPRNPRRVAFDAVDASEALLEQAPAETPEPVKVAPREEPRPPSPAVVAAAQTVELPPPPPPRDQPVGRAANDPREVRRREREAQLRREGEVIRPDSG
jgi:ribonuclease E